MDVISDVGLNFAHVVYYYLLPVLIVLGIMIFFHELGHFLVAKCFGVRVLKFALGFGPKLIGKKVGETEYSIRYLPLGGFVKMLGEDVEDEESKNLPPEEAEKSFSNKHVLKRMAIVGAGPLFNLGLALFIFFALYLISGIHVMVPEIGQVRPNSPADNAGLMKGDIVVSIQEKKIRGWFDIKELVHDKAGIPLDVTIKRVDRLVTLTVIPEEVTQDVFGQEVKSALIGIVSSGEVKKIEPGPLEAMKEATMETWRWMERICSFIIKIFQGGMSIKMLGGPIMIGQMTGQIAQESFGYLVKFIAIISINLGILNLFPIPILDGGLIIFLFVELLLGKPISLKKRELAQRVGLMFLVLLMIIVTYNDLTRIKLFEKLFG